LARNAKKKHNKKHPGKLLSRQTSQKQVSNLFFRGEASQFQARRLQSQKRELSISDLDFYERVKMFSEKHCLDLNCTVVLFKKKFFFSSSKFGGVTKTERGEASRPG
jgi:hypothetical protein